MKLRDWLPRPFFAEFQDSRANRYLDVDIEHEYRVPNADWREWVGKEKNVLNWVVLSNGVAVGFNENPSRGWSFPVKKME